MERPYIFNRDGKRVIIPKVSSIPATREWLANIMTYCQANGIITRITSYNVCYTKLLRRRAEFHSI